MCGGRTGGEPARTLPPIQQQGRIEGPQATSGDPKACAAQCMGEHAGGQGSVTPSPCPPVVLVPFSPIATRFPPQANCGSLQHHHPQVPHCVPRSPFPLVPKPWVAVVTTPKQVPFTPCWLGDSRDLTELSLLPPNPISPIPGNRASTPQQGEGHGGTLSCPSGQWNPLAGCWHR